MKKEKIKFVPTTCQCCGQTDTYILPVSKGVVNIVKGLARCIKQKQINVAHIAKELLAEGYITANERNNISRPRSHGLVAHIPNETGNYCLTKKGAAFLRGEITIPKYAICSKTTGHQIGYFEPEKHFVHVAEYNEPGQMWEGIGFEVTEGRVISSLEK